MDSIHLICLAHEVLQLERWFLTQSKRRGVSKQMLSSPDAEEMPLPRLPLLRQLQTHPKVFFLQNRFCWQRFTSFPLGASGCCGRRGALWNGAGGGVEKFVIYCCFRNPFCRFGNPCLGLGPLGVACKTLQEVECLPKFLAEGFFNSPQGINDSFSHGEPSSPYLHLLSFVCVSKHKQHILVNKSPF